MGSYVVANYPSYLGNDVLFLGNHLRSFLAPYAVALYWKGINKAERLGGYGRRLSDRPCSVAVSGFKTPNGPLYACLAMAVSLALCFLVSVIAKRAGWKSGKPTTFFYTGTAEEWRAKHHIVKKLNGLDYFTKSEG